MMLRGKMVFKAETMIGHMEHYLGGIETSWISGSDGERLPFQVVKCSGEIEDTAVFCTLGLSDHPFSRSDRDAPPIRHELLIAVTKSFGEENCPALLQQLGLASLSRNEAFLHGEVIGGTHEVFKGRPFRGFWAVPPVFVEEDAFAVYKRDDGQEVVFAWMVPLWKEEIDFVRKHGWTKLEDEVIAKDVDLVELNRDCIIARPDETIVDSI
jgi:hypothetical protein